MHPRIQIEIGCRSLREPFTMRPVTSFLDEAYAERDFSILPVAIPSVNPERTFLEKLFLLHEEFHKPLGKIRVDRLSRHLYDVYQLSNTVFDKAFKNSTLYQTIVEHRYNFTRVGEVNYNSLAPQLLNFIPVEEVMTAWEKDYKKMKEEMIYHTDAPSFEEMIKHLKILRSTINQLNWELEKTYPEK